LGGDIRPPEAASAGASPPTRPTRPFAHSASLLGPRTRSCPPGCGLLSGPDRRLRTQRRGACLFPALLVRKRASRRLVSNHESHARESLAIAARPSRPRHSWFLLAPLCGSVPLVVDGRQTGGGPQERPGESDLQVSWERPIMFLMFGRTPKNAREIRPFARDRPSPWPEHAAGGSARAPRRLRNGGTARWRARRRRLASRRPGLRSGCWSRGRKRSETLRRGRPGPCRVRQVCVELVDILPQNVT